MTFLYTEWFLDFDFLAYFFKQFLIVETSLCRHKTSYDNSLKNKNSIEWFKYFLILTKDLLRLLLFFIKVNSSINLYILFWRWSFISFGMKKRGCISKNQQKFYETGYEYIQKRKSNFMKLWDVLLFFKLNFFY